MCLHPLLIDLGTHKISSMKIPTGVTLARWFSHNRTNFNLVPCGSCVECLQSKSACYTSKLLAESLLHKEVTGLFVTLTYDDFHLPDLGTLEPDVFTRFNYYLRKYVVKPKRINGKLVRPSIDSYLRYFGIGEYGTKFDRPHYHMVCWSELLSQNDLIGIFHSFWKDENGLIGQIDLQPFTSDGAVGYVSKYHSKRKANILKGSLSDVTSLAYKLSNNFVIPPYIRCSKNLGLDFFLKPEIQRIYLNGGTYKFHNFNLVLPSAYREKVLGKQLTTKLKKEYEQKQIDKYFSDISDNISEDETFLDYTKRITFQEKQKLKQFLNKQTSKF